MLKPWQFALVSGLALVALALVITNIILFNGNREIQNEVTNRAQYIQQALQLEPLHQGIIRNLAEIAAQTSDAQIAQLLAAQGITFAVNPPSTSGKETKPPEKGQKGKEK